MNEGDSMTFTCKESQAINETKSVSRLKTNQISCFHQIKKLSLCGSGLLRWKLQKIRHFR